MGSSLMTILAINWLAMLGSLNAAYEVAHQELDQLECSTVRQLGRLVGPECVRFVKIHAFRLLSLASG